MIHVTERQVVIVLDVGDDLVEQVYKPEQFSYPLVVGDCVMVQFNIVKIQRVDAFTNLIATKRKNVVDLPREF